ncbi:hypothetical protein LUX29_20485 [Aureimonas altamirensis]|uniref:hypothetical protein n=1 Tax=Aureimonas altamirensis TaxID=370622 RepID=UPI001E4F575A|nr:hypothetical protein [Aureimonas altamirensis]UHD45340.1 hypothetical protein LUX29_20485 [Aureimonas altamirensis]
MDHSVFFASARAQPFNGSLSQSAVDGMTAIIKAFDQYGDGDVRKLAYILATAFHESDRFKTMEEYASGKAYEGRKDLGNTQPGDGVRFKGRGFVQLTGRRNYADWAKRTGLDLVGNPNLVTERDLAARILVQGVMLGTFTTKKLGDYQTYADMRRTVNGTDKASLIAGYATLFESALKKAGFGPPSKVTSPPALNPSRNRALVLAEINALVAEYATLEN